MNPKSEPTAPLLPVTQTTRRAKQQLTLYLPFKPLSLPEPPPDSNTYQPAHTSHLTPYSQQRDNSFFAVGCLQIPITPIIKLNSRSHQTQIIHPFLLSQPEHPQRNTTMSQEDGGKRRSFLGTIKGKLSRKSSNASNLSARSTEKSRGRSPSPNTATNPFYSSTKGGPRKSSLASVSAPKLTRSQNPMLLLQPTERP